MQLTQKIQTWHSVKVTDTESEHFGRAGSVRLVENDGALVHVQLDGETGLEVFLAEQLAVL